MTQYPHHSSALQRHQMGEKLEMPQVRNVITEAHTLKAKPFDHLFE